MVSLYLIIEDVSSKKLIFLKKDFLEKRGG